MQGLLFSSDFLQEGIRHTAGWLDNEHAFIEFRERLRTIFDGIDAATSLNEAQTEDDIILPIMAALGWSDFLRQANASNAGRQDVPDFLFFEGPDYKREARSQTRAADRYRHGKLIVEAKRWLRPLDRGDGSDPLDSGTPSNQMLRYLSRVEVASDGNVTWGILTNGATWRLYWQGARSRSEEFVQFDIAALAAVAGVNADMFGSTTSHEDVHALRAFFMLFRRQGFLPQPGDADGRSFHAVVLQEGRLWETRVSNDLGKRVFDELFPQLAAAIVRNDPSKPSPATIPYLQEVHRASLILLYRLLFVLYAEDRALLPVNDPRYDDYSLRWQRNDIAARRDRGDAFSASATRIWQHLRSLFRAIDQGDDSIGLPPYNGGLFHEEPGDLLARIELRDAELAPLLDGLSRRPDLSGRGFINYRDLAVQHLGSIYERLLEQRLIEDADGAIVVQPSTFARKNSGSYYTHDDLVQLILREAITPLADERITAFEVAIARIPRARRDDPLALATLAEADPAEALLGLKVCDPAMGSGHFLVSLVDDLTDRVLEQLADATAKAMEAGIVRYRSPLQQQIESLRAGILERATQANWSIDQTLLDDRHLVRRMVLKRVVHGVDKNPMAVELAKLALWLHTFTVGAPLSFLDHHLRTGDSLYGESLGLVASELSAPREYGPRAARIRLGSVLTASDMAGLMLAADTLADINTIQDISLQEVERSRSLLQVADDTLGGLRRVLDFWHAVRWLAPLDTPPAKRGERHLAMADLISGRYGPNLMAVLGAERLQSDDPDIDARANAFLAECRALAVRENFLHWELAFPGVWRNPLDASVAGGFDAVIGNPPWDRIKLQEVEWFAERRPQIALNLRAADRKRMIAALKREGDPLAADYALAAQQAEDAARVARSSGQYPLLSAGDINLYSLFVERAERLVAPQGMVGLLTPSGIAADKGAAPFFRGIATGGRLAALLDFENKKVFFPDIHASFKFCALVFGGSGRHFDAARSAFFLHAVDELRPVELGEDADEATRLRATRLIHLTADDFAAVNPNTGTAPIFRNALDAQLTTRIYAQHPVLVRHLRDAGGRPAGEARLYPVRYLRMFDMTNDSGLFRTRAELEAEGYYPVAGGRWKKGEAEMLPLYEGKMVQMYDHRAAGVTVNAENVHRPAQPFDTSYQQHQRPDFFPPPQFFVDAECVAKQVETRWALGFKHVSAPTNVRTMIAAICPEAGAGNSLPLIVHDPSGEALTPLLLANLNCLGMDYVLRQKLQGQNLNLFIVEQLPLIDPARYAEPLGNTTIGDFVREQVLRLSYTAHDLAPFARDLGYHGPPFTWDAEDRRHRMARLDALYFNLYGLDRSEAAYVLDTFPIVREQDEREFGRYRTRELVLAYMSALAAGDTETVVDL